MSKIENQAELDAAKAAAAAPKRKPRKASMFRVMSVEALHGASLSDIPTGVNEGRKIIDAQTPGVYVTVCIRDVREAFAETVKGSRPAKL